MFDGDIMLTEYVQSHVIKNTSNFSEQVELLKNYENGTNLKDLPSSLYQIWPNNTVYYEFGENFGISLKTCTIQNYLATNRYEYVRLPVKKLQDNTCLTFQENKTAINRIKVGESKGWLEAICTRPGLLF